MSSLFDVDVYMVVIVNGIDVLVLWFGLLICLVKGEVLWL